jgi:hypothetical protein
VSTRDEIDQPNAERWLRQLREQERCAWCGDDDRKLGRERLCDACVRTRRTAARLRKVLYALPRDAHKFDKSTQIWEMRVAERMIELCKLDGRRIDEILNGEVFDAVSVERSFSLAARAISGEKDCYHGIACKLACAFTPEQQRILTYLLWKPQTVLNKRRRWKMAASALHREDAKQANRQIADSDDPFAVCPPG